MEKLLLEERIRVNEKDKKAVRDVMKELFGTAGVAEDEDSIMKNFQRYAQNTINEILPLEPQYQNYQYPGKKALMLIAPSDKAVFGQEEKVVFDKHGHDGCFELYSMSLIQKIQGIFPDLEDQTTYGLNGKLIPSLHAVYFPLSSLRTSTVFIVQPAGTSKTSGLSLFISINSIPALKQVSNVTPCFSIWLYIFSAAPPTGFNP